MCIQMLRNIFEWNEIRDKHKFIGNLSLKTDFHVRTQPTMIWFLDLPISICHVTRNIKIIIIFIFVAHEPHMTCVKRHQYRIWIYSSDYCIPQRKKKKLWKK